MDLKYNNELLSEWLDKVQAAEMKRAKAQLAKGIPIEQVMQEYSYRFIKKGLHPILTHLKDVKTNYDSAKAIEDYNSKFASRGPVADHVIDD